MDVSHCKHVVQNSFQTLFQQKENNNFFFTKIYKILLFFPIFYNIHRAENNKLQNSFLTAGKTWKLYQLLFSTSVKQSVKVQQNNRNLNKSRPCHGISGNPNLYWNTKNHNVWSLFLLLLLLLGFMLCITTANIAISIQIPLL